MSDTTPGIPTSTARHVLWLYGADGGTEPGGFTLQLLRLLAAADYDNRKKLAATYPAEAAAIDMGRSDADGITTLQQIAAGRGIYCVRCWGSDGPFEQRDDFWLCEGCNKPGVYVP